MANRVLRDWTDSENIDKLSFHAEVFFTRLFMKADDYGCFHANPKLVKAALFPLKEITEEQVLKWMDECFESGLILWYTSNDKKYLQIVNFGQRLRSMKRRFPEPVSNSLTNDGDSQKSAASCNIPPPETETETKQNPKQETETIIRIGNELFKKNCSAILLNEYKGMLEAVMLSTLRGVDKTDLLARMDNKYPIYEFRDRNHFQNALRSIGEDMKGGYKKGTSLAEEINKKHNKTV